MFSAARRAVARPATAAIGRVTLNAYARQRFLSALAILEQRDGQLSAGSLSAVTAAKVIGGSVHGFLAGASVKSAAEEAAKVDGIEKILIVNNVAYEKGLPENYAPLLVENIKKGGYTHVIAANSAFAKGVLPRVSALLDSQQISDVTAIQDEKTFVRPIYAGNAIATVESTDAIKILTVRGTAFAAATLGSGSAAIEEGADPKAEATAEWVSEDLAKSDRPDLATASKVVSGGRGLKSKEEFDNIMLPLADALGAAVGASRAAVDSGYADNSLQVGQTGKVVAPEMYLAVGISGAIQHLAGMKDSKVIAAINKDADAPIFQIADVGLVGDLFEKVPELTEKLKSS
ncbi:electron transfer flavoprotein alpha-subunit [Cordyceps militaris CM01]|uniref:Probable electron transfer flavoprotein subunit alpha n=1 Tax=Cordyceps militaris (strain CM01) TaxID=983644 RepID=G3JCP9_CORMM|nr:electron transfer flavoprotein alpha-subunit [Cordyceps militaris CM01]EGX94657.1 electron transfer flavoprotein alpha-subunit [Cordyceps militaris CM01]